MAVDGLFLPHARNGCARASKRVHNEECIGCGLCEGTCPDVFSISDDGVAVAIEEDVPEDAEDAAQEAADNCPVSAIVVE